MGDGGEPQRLKPIPLYAAIGTTGSRALPGFGSAGERSIPLFSLDAALKRRSSTVSLKSKM
jgi:hypothetical protein